MLSSSTISVGADILGEYRDLGRPGDVYVLAPKLPFKPYVSLQRATRSGNGAWKCGLINLVCHEGAPSDGMRRQICPSLNHNSDTEDGRNTRRCSDIEDRVDAPHCSTLILIVHTSAIGIKHGSRTPQQGTVDRNPTQTLLRVLRT